MQKCVRSRRYSSAGRPPRFQRWARRGAAAAGRGVAGAVERGRGGAGRQEARRREGRRRRRAAELEAWLSAVELEVPEPSPQTAREEEGSCATGGCAPEPSPPWLPRERGGRPEIPPPGPPRVPPERREGGGGELGCGRRWSWPPPCLAPTCRGREGARPPRLAAACV